MPKERKPPPLRDKALAYLARREHSRTELARKLKQAGHIPEDIEPLLDEFEARNWLSDHRFAESYVADHRTRSGPVKLAYELRQRGVSDNIIEGLLSKQHDSEFERAHEVWIRKYGYIPADACEKARQMRFLQSRGFTPEVIRRLFRSSAEGD